MELKANELRIGNLVQTNQGVFKVTKISQNEIDICPFLSNEPFSIFINTVKPIPLTEEWLLKFGFVQSDNDLFELTIKKDGSGIGGLWCRSETGLKISLNVFDRSTDEQTDLKFDYLKGVHQLQNLYFALTGEELEIKM